MQASQGKQIIEKGNSLSISEEHNFEFYHEYVRLHIANVVLTNQMKDLLSENSELTNKINKLEKKSEVLGEQYGEDDDRKKRHRRTATQIDRHYKCPIESCQKSYGQSFGSEGSLNQHLKLKHPSYVQEISDDQENGEELGEELGEESSFVQKIEEVDEENVEEFGNEETQQSQQKENEKDIKNSQEARSVTESIQQTGEKINQPDLLGADSNYSTDNESILKQKTKQKKKTETSKDMFLDSILLKK